MSADETAIFRSVDVIRDAGTAFLCLIGRKECGSRLPRSAMAPI
jgi:hypothetical protein